MSRSGLLQLLSSFEFAEDTGAISLFFSIWFQVTATVQGFGFLWSKWLQLKHQSVPKHHAGRLAPHWLRGSIPIYLTHQHSSALPAIQILNWSSINMGRGREENRLVFLKWNTDGTECINWIILPYVIDQTKQLKWPSYLSLQSRCCASFCLFFSQGCLLHIASRQIHRPFYGTSQARLVNLIFPSLSLARLCEMFLKRRFVESLSFIRSTDMVG